MTKQCQAIMTRQWQAIMSKQCQAIMSKQCQAIKTKQCHCQYITTRQCQAIMTKQCQDIMTSQCQAMIMTRQCNQQGHEISVLPPHLSLCLCYDLSGNRSFLHSPVFVSFPRSFISHFPFWSLLTLIL